MNTTIEHMASSAGRTMRRRICGVDCVTAAGVDAVAFSGSAFRGTSTRFSFGVAISTFVELATIMIELIGKRMRD